MANSYTTTYSLTKPEVGAAEDQWGDLLNANLDAIDDLLDGTTAVTGIDINSGTIDGVTIGGTTAPTVTNIDINGGTIDGTVIGGASAAAVTGTTITGSGFVSTGNMSFGDNNKAIFGAGSDLQIYHDGANSYVSEAGVGALRLQGTNLQLQSSAGVNYLQGINNDRVDIYYNGSVKLATTSTGVDVTGTVTADGLTVDGVARIQGAATGVVINETDTTDLNTYLNSNNGSFRVLSTNDAFSLFKERINVNHATGDISFYEDTGTTPKLFWDASAEALGIGTTSPSRTLFVNGVAGFGNGTIETIISYSDRGIFGTQSNHALELRTNGTERLRITSTGNVGIGTSSPTNKLTVAGGIDFSASAFSGSGTGIWSPLTNELGFVTAGSTRLRIDASGNVGIGTTSPAAKLDVLETYDTVANILANGTYAAKFTSNTFGDAGRAQGILLGGVNSYGRGAAILGEAQSTGNAHDMIFAVSSTGSTPTERLRIDASGNLLVGKTAASSATVGAQLNSTGIITATSLSYSPLILNRTTTDGDIAVFRKDGTTVGSIGSNTSSVYFGGGDTGILCAPATNIIAPWNTTTNLVNNGNLDLGYSGGRFKDLYLSGGVYLGGTGAANLLDDYEEGTWTPTIVATGTNPTVSYSARNGAYVKVGNSVTIHVYMLLSSFSGGSGTVQLGSLPFTPSATRCSGSLSYSSGFPVAPQACLNSSSSPSVTLYYFSGSTVIGVPTTDLNGNEQFRLSLTYEV